LEDTLPSEFSFIATVTNYPAVWGRNQDCASSRDPKILMECCGLWLWSFMFQV